MGQTADSTASGQDGSGAREPHEDAIRVSSSTRFVYADPDKGVALVNRAILAAVPRVGACSRDTPV